MNYIRQKALKTLKILSHPSEISKDESVANSYMGTTGKVLSTTNFVEQTYP